MSGSFKTPSRILMPTDLSDNARGALEYAAAMAKSNDADLYVLHVLTEHRFDANMPHEAVRQTEEQIHRMEQLWAGRLADAAEQTKADVRVHTRTVWSRSAYDAILEFAEKESIETIVMGTRGRTGLSYVLLGSVTEKVVRHASVPVLVVRERKRNLVRADGEIVLKRILFPTDLSEKSAEAAPLARAIADQQEAEIMVAHIIPNSEATVTELMETDTDVSAEQRDAARASFRERAEHLFPGFEGLQTVISWGTVARGILDVAESNDIDLIVMASAGRNSFGDHLLGSTAERVLRQADCPVYIVK